MNTVEILCPDCGKLLLKVTADSKATMFCWCRRCKAEKTITHTRANEPSK